MPGDQEPGPQSLPCHEDGRPYRPQPPTLPTAPQATTSEDKMTLPLWRADSERRQHSFPPLPVLVKKEAITHRLHSDTFGPGQIIPPARQAQESLGHSPPACWERAEDSRAGRMLCFSFAHLWLLISSARGGMGGLGALSETSHLALFSFSPSFFSFCLVFCVSQLSVTAAKYLKKLKRICLGSWV